MYKVTATTKGSDKHEADVAVLHFQNGKLFSGGNDGKIKIWNTNLNLEKTINAHPVNVYDISTSDTVCYSSSNDGTLKAWNVSTGKLIQVLSDNSDEEILKLYYTNDKLYAGDIKGNVKVFENHQQLERFETFEEITGLCVSNNFLFTAGNLSVVITEVKPGNKGLYTTRKTEDGRGPIHLANDKLCFLNRDGRVISILDTNQNFKIIGNLQGHEMIVNTIDVNEQTNRLFSGGYDKCMKIWDLATEKLMASIDLEQCVNAIACDEKNVYVTGDDGIIKRLNTV